MLLDADADPLVVDADGESALHKASARGHPGVVRALLATPFRQAARNAPSLAG